MEQCTLELISIVALVVALIAFVIVMAVWVNAKRSIGSRANETRGGSYIMEPPVNTIAERLLNIYNEGTGIRDRLLDDYLRTLSNNDTSDILRAIVQLASVYSLGYNYIYDVLTKCERQGLINSENYIERRLHDAIINSNNGTIVIPEDLRRRIINPNAILSRN